MIKQHKSLSFGLYFKQFFWWFNLVTQYTVMLHHCLNRLQLHCSYTLRFRVWTNVTSTSSQFEQSFKSCTGFAAKWHLAPARDAFWYYILVWTRSQDVPMKFYLCSNQQIIMLSMYASGTIHIYWWPSDYYYYIEKKNIAALWWIWRIIVSGQIVASLPSLYVTKWLNDCTNGNYADVTFVQTQKSKSLMTGK